MKRIKLLGLIALISLASVVLTACGTFSGYDDDAAIVGAMSFSELNTVTTTTPSKLTVICGKFNGVKKLKEITVSENPIFKMTLEIKSGRFKVVLVKENEVFIVCDSDTENPVSVEIPAGKYSLRIVGEDAKFKFELYN